MKLLYYSTSYYASHGGSVQAIEFYGHLDRLKTVQQKGIFPEKIRKPSLGNKKRSSFKQALKKIPLLQILFFYRRNTFYLQELERLLTKKEFNVVVLQIDSNFLQIKKLKEKFPNLLICSQVNGSPFDEPFKNIGFSGTFLKIQRKAYTYADMNFFISDFLRYRIMGTKVNLERDKVIQNGTDTKKFKPLENKMELRLKLGYPKDKFIIGYVGTIDKHKKMEVLVEAFSNLLPQYPQLELVIIGEGPAFPHLREQVQLLKLNSKVNFQGWVIHNHINEHLNCFDIAIHHQANDYMSPLKIFEYLAAGVPVIGPDIPSVREVFQCGDQLLLTGSTEQEIQDNIIEILKNPEAAKKRANRGRSFVEENFTWAHYTEKIINFIEQKQNKQL